MSEWVSFVTGHAYKDKWVSLKVGLSSVGSSFIYDFLVSSVFPDF